MSQTTQLLDALKRVLKSRGLTYQHIAERIGLSEASVKRLFAEESFTLQKLENVCVALEIDFFELAKLARGVRDSADMLTPDQEKKLADNPKLLAIFYLLYNEWDIQQIQAHYEITEADCIRLMSQLEKIGVLDLLPNNRVKLKVSRNLRLRLDGAIRSRYGQDAMQDFLMVRFEEYGGLFRFEFRELSAASVEIIKRKIERLAAEFNELAELDSTLPPQRRKTIGVGLGIRPWTISFVTGLKERTKLKSQQRQIN
jgi:transcriptional regulator with XRE-family HTH domain